MMGRNYHGLEDGPGGYQTESPFAYLLLLVLFWRIVSPDSQITGRDDDAIGWPCVESAGGSAESI